MDIAHYHGSQHHDVTTMSPRTVASTARVFVMCLLVVSMVFAMDDRFGLAAEDDRYIAGAARLSVVELRQYSLVDGKRDTLIELFEREFIEGQEAAGMAILGQFRDLDRPDRFVWIRAFPDMPSRAQALQTFYDGPIWQEHRAAANATMVDSDNVLLLKPARDDAGFIVDRRHRAARGATTSPSNVVTAAICPFAGQVDMKFVEFFEGSVRPIVEKSGGRVLGYFVTEASPNTFPRLPVRENEHVFVWFASFADDAAHVTTGEWRRVATNLENWLSGKPELLRLRPTPRSLLGR
jgi:NIPSNAP